MLNYTIKHALLPFQKERTEQVEAVAVFALAEFERSKGGGLFNKQPEEKIVFLSKFGYPLLLVPRKNRVHIFHGLKNSSYTFSCAEAPSAQVFIKSFEANEGLLENYLSFLLSYVNYLQKPKKTNFTIKGLINNPDFTNDFTLYHKEALEINDKTVFHVWSSLVQCLVRWQ
jgi:hypothetical protein